MQDINIYKRNCSVHMKEKVLVNEITKYIKHFKHLDITVLLGCGAEGLKTTNATDPLYVNGHNQLQ